VTQKYQHQQEEPFFHLKLLWDRCGVYS
jgi:hypothetical protein